MIYIYDLSGQNIYTGPEWADLTGQDFDGSLGRNFLERIHFDDRALVEDTRSKAIETTCEYTLRFRLMKPDDSFRWVTTGAKPLFGTPDQNLLGFKGSLSIVADAPASGLKSFVHLDRPVLRWDERPESKHDYLDRIAHHVITATSLMERHQLHSALPGARNVLFHVARAMAKRQKKIHSFH